MEPLWDQILGRNCGTSKKALMCCIFDWIVDREVTLAANSHDMFIPPEGLDSGGSMQHAFQFVSILCEHVFQRDVQSAARFEWVWGHILEGISDRSQNPNISEENHARPLQNHVKLRICATAKSLGYSEVLRIVSAALQAIPLNWEHIFHVERNPQCKLRRFETRS